MKVGISRPAIYAQLPVRLTTGASYFKVLYAARSSTFGRLGQQTILCQILI